VAHRDPQQGAGDQHGLGGEPVAGGGGLTARRADPGEDLRVHGVVAQVVEQRLLVDPDQVVDEGLLGGAPELLTGGGRDGVDLGEDGRVDEPAVVGAARGPAPAEGLELLDGRGGHRDGVELDGAEQVLALRRGEVHLGEAQGLADGPAVAGGDRDQGLEEHPGAYVRERDAEALGGQAAVEVVEDLRAALVEHPHRDRLGVVGRGVPAHLVEEHRPRAGEIGGVERGCHAAQPRRDPHPGAAVELLNLARPGTNERRSRCFGSSENAVRSCTVRADDSVSAGVRPNRRPCRGSSWPPA
jgi:hypothetical protein